MKFGLLFAFQTPPESGIPWNEPYRDMLECLPRAEDLGYVSSFQVSHHAQRDGLCPGPLVAVAGAASVTAPMNQRLTASRSSASLGMKQPDFSAAYNRMAPD